VQFWVTNGVRGRTFAIYEVRHMGLVIFAIGDGIPFVVDGSAALEHDQLESLNDNAVYVRGKEDVRSDTSTARHGRKAPKVLPYVLPGPIA